MRPFALKADVRGFFGVQKGDPVHKTRQIWSIVIELPIESDQGVGDGFFTQIDLLRQRPLCEVHYGCSKIEFV